LKVPIADLPAQYRSLKSEIDAATVGVIESSCFIGGENVRKLEEEIAHECGAKHGIAVASGTDALVLSLVACGIGRGDEVITTPFTFGATTEAIALVGATPVYVDVDVCTFNLDCSVGAIESKVTDRTRAILPVDLFGHMADRAALTEIASRYNLRLIVDSAQSIGARQNGQPIASAGDATTLSFYPTKNLGAYGDGGMVLTNHNDIAEMLRSLRDHGQSSYGYHERVGYCSRLDSIQAAILRVKLPHLALWNEQRRRNAEIYNEHLADVASADNAVLVLPGFERGNYHVYHQYTIRHTNRNQLQAYLKENGVDTKVFYPHPAHLQNAYSYLRYGPNDFPWAEQAAREVLSLPIQPELTEQQIVFVCDLIRQFHN
jgi:dTDP-4-amino-4,6-dideoxygalactose transaminase